MNLSISKGALIGYVRRQLNAFFPDALEVSAADLKVGLPDALRRLEHCFIHLRSPRYQIQGAASFDHLYSDQYLMFLWFLANSLWKAGTDRHVLNKLYLLNKCLHSFDCAFDTELPEIFVVIHGIGIVLGKAKYSDYLVVYHGCTVGQSHGVYPVIGRAVGLGAGAAVIGGCALHEYVSVGAGCALIGKSIPAHSSVYRNNGGRLSVRRTRTHSIAGEYFWGL